MDEALIETNTVEVPYENKFKGTVNVDGASRVKEIKVETYCNRRKYPVKR